MPGLQTNKTSADQSIYYYLGFLRQNRTLIGLTTVAALLFAILFLHLASYKYTAQIVIVPSQASSGGVGKQIGSLASLAGIDLAGSQKASAFDLYLEEINAREIADILAQNTELMKNVFPTEWDAVASKWVEPHGMIIDLAKFVKRLLGFPSTPWTPPNGARLENYIEKMIKVEQKPKKPTVAILMTHNNPVFAKNFLNALHNAIDGKLRERALNTTSSYIDYLSKKLAIITVAEYRAAIASILSDQEKLRMIASSSTPYAADTLGGAEVSFYPTSPDPKAVLVLAFLGGICAGIGLAWLKLLLQGGRALP